MAVLGQIAGTTTLSSTALQIVWSTTSGVVPAEGSTGGIMTFNIFCAGASATALRVNIPSLIATTSSWETISPGREAYFRVGARGIDKILAAGSSAGAVATLVWGPRGGIPGA